MPYWTAQTERPAPLPDALAASGRITRCEGRGRIRQHVECSRARDPAPDVARHLVVAETSLRAREPVIAIGRVSCRAEHFRLARPLTASLLPYSPDLWRSPHDVWDRIEVPGRWEGGSSVCGITTPESGRLAGGRGGCSRRGSGARSMCEPCSPASSAVPVRHAPAVEATSAATTVAILLRYMMWISYQYRPAHPSVSVDIWSSRRAQERSRDHAPLRAVRGRRGRRPLGADATA